MPEASTIRKANQIAANFEYQEPDEAAKNVAAHIRAYWPPPMRAELLELARRGDGSLKPLAVAAAELLVETRAS